MLVALAGLGLVVTAFVTYIAYFIWVMGREPQRPDF